MTMHDERPKILVVDDEEYTRAYFKGILPAREYAVSFAHDGSEALNLWAGEAFDLIIMDIRMPVLDGMEALRRIRAMDTDTMVIMVSAFGDMDSVIDAMRLGANDFFAKPFSSIDKIRLDIRKCLEKRALLRENSQLRQQVAAELSTGDLVFASREMENVVGLAARASGLDMPVLVLGESGTGKEVLARFIHARSPRAQAPFFAVNCGALAESLLEPTLFGYEKGAFTGAVATTPGYFEAAHGGTILLDEIGETAPSFQVKLLRVLQDGEIMRVGGTKTIRVDFRLISATNSDLDALIRTGGFRKDLFYRINVVRIEIPPLRERPDDIPVLLEHFMGQVCRRNNLRPRRFARDAMDCLMAHPWEGNVRELRNLVERLVVSPGRGGVARKDLPEEYVSGCRKAAPADGTPLPYEQAKARFEEDYLRRLLEAAEGDLKKASALSGLDLSTLYRRKNKIIA